MAKSQWTKWTPRQAVHAKKAQAFEDLLHHWLVPTLNELHNELQSGTKSYQKRDLTYNGLRTRFEYKHDELIIVSTDPRVVAALRNHCSEQGIPYSNATDGITISYRSGSGRKRRHLRLV